MAKGRDKHQAQKAAVNALGRGLNRRAKSHCELCSQSTSLKVLELDGSPFEEPDESWALMLCARCEGLVSGNNEPANTLRFLETAAWSEVQPVQIQAVRLIKTVDASWARDCAESLYLDPEVEALL
jgi:protein PhnA